MCQKHCLIQETRQAHQLKGGLKGDNNIGRGQAVDIINVRHDQHLCLRLGGCQTVEMNSGVKGGNAYLHPVIVCIKNERQILLNGCPVPFARSSYLMPQKAKQV